MREIKFRGKATRDHPALKIKKGDWVYGYLVDKYLISVDIYMDDYGDLHCVLVEVDPETVGQYTTVDDKNGKEIYEGDIVKIKYEAVIDWISCRTKEIEAIGKVIFLNEDYRTGRQMSEFVVKTLSTWIKFFNCKEIETLGNIYENPELLEGKDD